MKIKHNATKKLAAVILALVLLAGSLSPALAEAFSAIVAANSITVYGDTLLSRKVGTLQKDSVVRVTGYLVKKSEIEKLRANRQSLNNVTVFGKGAQDGGHALDRRIQRYDESAG